jgi:hypothetical protein
LSKKLKTSLKVPRFYKEVTNCAVRGADPNQFPPPELASTDEGELID